MPPALAMGYAISIHAPREGGDKEWSDLCTVIGISIHAPREGGDNTGRAGSGWRRDFNPRPPRGGRRRGRSTGRRSSDFNPRPPRGGRPSHSSTCRRKINFNPRPPRGGRPAGEGVPGADQAISIHAPREGGDSKDAQFYLRIFDKQVELLRFLGKIRGGCLRNPEKDRRFLGKSLANLPEISGHLDFAGGGKARPGYPCAVPLPRRAACVRGSGDPPADRCSSYRNAPLFSHIASLDSKSADCLSQNP